MIARRENRCSIDPHVVDRFGIPVLRFDVRWSDQEYLQVKHMQETFRALIREMGGEPFGDMPSEEDGYGIAPGGRIIPWWYSRNSNRMDDVLSKRISIPCGYHLK